MKKIILIVGIVLAALGAGAGGMLFMQAKNAGAQPAAAAETAAEEAPPEKTHRIALEERTLNLADTEEAHFLKIVPILEVVGGEEGGGEEAAKEAEKELSAPLMDALIEVVGRSSYTTLLTPDGKKKLKADLVAAFDKRLKPLKMSVHEVLFADFVME
jgi:flagellar basal body-associated protein FliL